MKILFVTSGAEPGRDGVGDYCRILAAALRSFGVSSRLLALNDEWIQKPEETGQPEELLKCLRLPKGIHWSERISWARKFVSEFGPDRISLQFVCYGWSRAGVDPLLGRRLQAIFGSRASWHVMFHETWKGDNIEAPFRDRFGGYAQQWFIKSIWRHLRPTQAHSHTPVYRAMLRRIGINPRLLPLMSNVPVAAPPAEPWLLEKCRAMVPASTPLWIGGFFGGIYPDWSAEPLFPVLQRAAKRLGRHLVIVSAGRLGGGASLWPQLVAGYPEITFLSLGELDSRSVSEYLQQLKFAIATTSWGRITKSSAVATVLDHGVPTLVSLDNWHWRRPFTEAPSDDPLLIRVDAGLEQRLVEGLDRRIPHHTASDVAAQFLADLRSADPQRPAG